MYDGFTNLQRLFQLDASGIAVVIGVRARTGEIAAESHTTMTGGPFERQSPITRKTLLGVDAAKEKGSELGLALIDDRHSNSKPQASESFVGASCVDRRRHIVGAILVSR